MPIPDGGQHQIYVTAHWRWTSTEWQGEEAMCGWRLMVWPIGEAIPRGQTVAPVVANATGGTIVIGEDTNYRWLVPWQANYGNDELGADEQLDLVGSVADYWNDVKPLCSPDLELVSVKVALIEPTGKYAAGASEFEFKTPVPGTGTAGQASPPELAIATTLRAPILGRRGRGRWYLPAPNATAYTGGKGKVVSNVSASMAVAGRDLVANFESPVTGWTENKLVVALGSASSSTMVIPSQVRVGDHVDVQRRRQHQVEENYTTESLT